MDTIIIAPNGETTITNDPESFASRRLGSIASALSFWQQKGVDPVEFELDRSRGARMLVASVPSSRLAGKRWDSHEVAEMRARILEWIQGLSAEQLQGLSGYLNSLPDQPEVRVR